MSDELNATDRVDRVSEATGLRQIFDPKYGIGLLVSRTVRQSFYVGLIVGWNGKPGPCEPVITRYGVN